MPSTRSQQHTLILDPPHDALAAVRGTMIMAKDPGQRRRGSEMVRATRTPQGPASLYLRQIRERVEATLWGDGSDWLAEHLPALIGMADTGWRDFAPTEEPLRSFHRRHPGLRLGRTGLVYEALLPTVLAQKVSGKEAGLGYRRLLQVYSEPAPGPVDLMLPPDPQVIRQLSYERFHPFGIERRRAELVRRLASRAKRLEEVADDSKALDRRLQSLRGVGPWTSAKVRFAACGDPDAVWVGDYNLPSFVAYNLVGEPRADDERMLELLEPYRGQRARVLRLLELGGKHPPRFGPRHALRKIENL